MNVIDNLTERLEQLEENIKKSKIRVLKKNIHITLSKIYRKQICKSEYHLKILNYKNKIYLVLSHLAKSIFKGEHIRKVYIEKQIDLQFIILKMKLRNKYISDINKIFITLHKIMNYNKDRVYTKINQSMIVKENIEKLKCKTEKILKKLFYEIINNTELCILKTACDCTRDYSCFDQSREIKDACLKYNMPKEVSTCSEVNSTNNSRIPEEYNEVCVSVEEYKPREELTCSDISVEVDCIKPSNTSAVYNEVCINVDEYIPKPDLPSCNEITTSVETHVPRGNLPSCVETSVNCNLLNHKKDSPVCNEASVCVQEYQQKEKIPSCNEAHIECKTIRYESTQTNVDMLNTKNTCNTTSNINASNGENFLCEHQHVMHLKLRIQSCFEKVTQNTLSQLFNTIMRIRRDSHRDNLNLKIISLFLKLKGIIHLAHIRVYRDREDLDDSIYYVIQEGCLENDKRFLKMVDYTLRDIEKYKDPVIVRMGVQFILAKKYVNDVITLKEAMKKRDKK